MWWSALIFGLLGSLHCVGMCGPIAFLLPVDHTRPLRKSIQVLLYHSGRIIAYSIIGLLFGLLGKGLYLFGLQQQLSIGIGALMVLMVLIPGRYFQNYRITGSVYKIISKVKQQLGSALKRKSPDAFLSIGFLNGFLPCGLVYMAVFGAIAQGHALEGSVYMMLFGIGTLPLMTTAIYLGTSLSSGIRQRVRKAVPVFLVLIGMLFILRGLGLGIPYVSPSPIADKVSAKTECHIPVKL